MPCRVLAQLPTGWTNQDIGLPGQLGSASFSAPTWTVAGGGSDIGGTYDSFHYAYRRSTNNAVIIARVNSFSPTNGAAKAGVMFRHSGDPSSTYAMVAATPENGVTFQWRNSHAGQTVSSTASGIYPPVWLRLLRAGTNFTGFYSPDGAAWTPLGPTQVVPMTNQPLAGLAVTAHDNAQLSTALFSGVVVSNTAAAPPAPPAIFGVHRQLWNNIAGGYLDALTNAALNPDWPDSPAASFTRVFSMFETELDFRDSYGQRVRSFLIPPTNGNYVFWVASDDNSELYLRDGEFPDTNIITLASVPGWTASREWTKYPEQQSAPVYLEAGRRYYLEARMAEGSGGDNLAVRIQLPDGSLEGPVSAISPTGMRLVPFDGVDLRPGIYDQSTNMTFVEGQTARLFVLVTNRSPVTYQWTANSAVLPGATNPVYSVSNLSVAVNNGQVYRCVVTNSAGAATNTPVTLAVVRDTIPPAVVRVHNIGTTAVQIFYSEQVEAATAANPNNYAFTSGLQVTAAALNADNLSVTLTTAPLVYGSNYTVVINAVRDRAPAPNTIATDTLASFTALPYSPVSIGGPTVPATVTVVDNGINLTGSGDSLGGYADQFGFGFTLRSGDFDVAARLESLTLSDAWAKAGLMARDNLEQSSRFAATFATPAINGCFFESRVFAGASSSVSGSFPLNYPYTWLRLKRSGSTFTGYAGFDGLNWMQLGSTNISMPGQIYFGFALSSHNPEQAATGAFRDITNVTAAIAGTVTSPREPLGVSSRKTPIVISEIMYKPAERADTHNLEFIELYNANPWFEDISGYQLVGDNMSYTFPAGTVIPGGGFVVVAAAPNSMATVYGLANVMGPYTGTLKVPDTLKLVDEQGALLLTVGYEDEHPWPVASNGTGHSLVMANRTYGEDDARAWDISDAIGGSPGRMDPYRPSPLRQVVINEFLAHTDLPDVDYIELYNHANQPVDVSGCILTDNAETNKYVIPGDTIIPARGFAQFTETTMGFALNAAGETVYFKSADQTRFLDAVHFGGQEGGVATGRWPDGSADWYRLIAKTPGTNNAAIRISDVVINELMYRPISRDDDDQFVELYNRGPAPVNLGGWLLSDGISFTFPNNTVIGSDGYLVVARNAARLRTNYPGLNPNNCIGDFNGRLAHNGERITLRMPDVILSTNNQGEISTNLIHITVNEVTYRSGGRWGEWADGGGSSLELKDPASNNRLAANWGDSDETQKAAWANIEVTDVLDNGRNFGDGPTIDYAQVGLLDPGECLVDNIEILPEGWGANVVANPDFESGLQNWSLQGCFSRSSLENGGYGGSLHSLHVRAGSRLFTGANSCQMALLGNTLGDGSLATIRFKARWLRGWPEVLLRLNGNWLEATARLPVPSNLGTPGARNSRYFGNTGPAIYNVNHSPAVPAAGQPVVVTASAHAASGVESVRLFYRLDPAISHTSVLMRDDGTGGDNIARDGVYSATIPGQFDGSIVAFYVSATDTRPTTSRFPALLNNGTPDPECVLRFGDETPGGSFAVYHLWLTETNAARWIELSDLSNEEHDCTMVCGNRVIYNVKARWAGSPYHQGFDRPDGNLCHYKWVFPEDDKFLGATSFNKIHQPGNGAGDDASIQREQLVNTFLRTLGVPWLTRRHVVVYVNGNRRGTLMEDAQTPDNDVVEQYFPNDEEGWLYKMQPWFEFGPFPQGMSIPFANQSWCNLMPYTTTGNAKKTARYRYMFLVRRAPASANDYTNVFSLVDAASSFGTPNYVANMEKLADMENWMRVFAANHAAGNWDAYGAQNAQNLYGYMGTKGTKYSLMMFDFNIVIGNSGSWLPGQNLFTVNTQDPNTRNIYNEPTFRRMYWRALQELVDGPLNPAVSGPRLDAKYNVFVMNGLNVENPNAAIKTWLSQARDSIAVQLAAVNAGAFSLNSSYTLSNNVAWLTGTAPVNIRSILVNGAEYPLAWTSLTQFRVGVPLQPGTNTLTVVGVDKNNQPFPGATSTISPVYSGSVPSPVGQVLINEISYAPPVEGAEYVELFNNSTNTFDLSGWDLQGLAYTFPPGAAIGPKSYLVLAANAAAYTAAYGVNTRLFDTFDGVLQKDGETLTLIKPGIPPENDVVVAKVRYGNSLPWPLAANTWGTSLQLVDVAQENWRAGNWMAVTDDMTVEPQWVYVTASGPANSSTLQIYLQSAGDIYLDDLKLVAGNVPEAGPNLLLNGNFETAFPGPWNVTANVALSALNTVVKRAGTASLHLVCSAAGTGQSSSLWQTVSPALVLNQTYTLSFWYLQSPNGGPLTLRIGSGITANINPAPESITRAPATPALPNSVAASLPSFPPLWINELQADNLTGITNRLGQRVPWVELFNPTASTVPLNGIYLATDFTNVMQWPFPANASIGPREFKVIFADGQPGLTTPTELHTSFQLPSSAGNLVLTRQTTNAQLHVLDYLTYSDLTPNHSYGSFPDAQVFTRQEFYFVTPAATNVGSGEPITVRINEWMAQNTAGIRNPANNNRYDDWFELYNYGPNPANLAGFFLTDNPANLRKFEIPSGYVIPPYGYLLVWADEVNTNGTPDLHVNFKLDRLGEMIGLYDGSGQPLDVVTFGLQTENVSMGRYPDGSSTFQPMIIPTPKTANIFNTAPILSSISDQRVYPGQTLVVFASAVDSDIPAQTLAYQLGFGAPPGMAIDPAHGQLTWTPATGPSTNSVTVIVTDNGIPPLSASQTFTVIVSTSPVVSGIGINGNTFSFGFATATGLNYQVEYSDTLAPGSWLPLGSPIAGTGGTIPITADVRLSAHRFYRVRVL